MFLHSQQKKAPSNVFEAKATRHQITKDIEVVLTNAGKEQRALSDYEQKQLVNLRSDMSALDAVIGGMENSPSRTLARLDPATALLSGGQPQGANHVGPNPLTRTADYATAFHTWLSSKGAVVDEVLKVGSDNTGGFLLPGSERLAGVSGSGFQAALDEGTPGYGGYAVPSVVVPLIVPLGMPDLGIFNESTVIPTVSDQKWPIQASFGQVAAKSESGSSTNAFQEIDPTIGTFTLSAYMAGGLRLLSWELIQDVAQFQQFATDDLIRSQLIYEGNLYVNGSGSGQAQGLIGNVGTGTGTAYQLTGAASDSQTLLDAVFDVVGTLKAVYQPNAVFVMSRSTGMALRRAQMQTNLFIPAITVDPDGTERLLGRRIAYDANMPSLPTATTAGVAPILYGSFKDGYLIGVRGGAGINVKVLDQPWAVDGQTGIIAYRRVDGRIRRSEAIQAVTISHS